MRLLVAIYGDHSGYNDPVDLTSRAINAFREDSGGRANYNLVDLVRPTGPIPSDFAVIARDLGLERRVEMGLVEEVWLWGPPGAGWYESRMAGHRAIWCNGPVLPLDCSRFVMQGFNYERGLAELLESYGHRVESIMRWPLGWHSDYIESEWDRFTALDRQFPGRAGIGNAHLAHNARVNMDYDRENPVPAYSAWLNETYGAERWGGTAEGYLRFWYRQMPRYWWHAILLGHASPPSITTALPGSPLYYAPYLSGRVIWQSNNGQPGELRCSRDGLPEVVVASGATSYDLDSAHGLNWIHPDNLYEFRVYQGGALVATTLVGPNRFDS